MEALKSGALSQAFMLAAIAYIVLVVLQLDDRNFLLFKDFLRVSFKLPVAGGNIELPGLSQNVSIFHFFLVGPFLVLGLHAFGLFDMARVGSDKPTAASQVSALSQLTAVLVLLAAPMALLLIARAYVPFATIQPDSAGGLAGRYWLVLLHLLLIALDLLLICYVCADPSKAGRATIARLHGRVASVALVGALIAAGVFVALEIGDVVGPLFSWAGPSEAAQNSELRTVLFWALLVVSPVLFAATTGQVPYRILLRWERVVDDALSAFGRTRSPVRRIPISRIDQPWRIPMYFRVFALTFALIATVQIGHARGIDVSNQILAARMPSEALIAAYISSGEPDAGMSSWTHAVKDHARGITLSGWRLDRADFSRSVLPKANFRGASLTGAKFDYATLHGGDLTGVTARDASFRYVDFKPVRVAQADAAVGAVFEGARLNDADLTGADLRNSIFSALRKEAEAGGGLLSKEDEFTPADHPLCREGDELPIFENVTLTGALLDGAYLDGVDFTKVADIRSVSLEGAHLRCAVFSCADLGALDFKDADLRGARFRSTRATNEPRPDDWNPSLEACPDGLSQVGSETKALGEAGSEQPREASAGGGDQDQ